MSKAELPGNQSLEEILASIRKTLAEDQSDQGLAKLDNVQPAAQDDAAAQANGSGAPAADALPGEGLTELLAGELSSPAQAPKPSIGPHVGPETRDAPWFLSRGSRTD